jgi:Fe-S cluster biogenesis protein NfuA
MLNESVETIESSAVDPFEPPPNRRAQIESAIAELRPRLQRDGGDIQLIAIDGDMVVVDLKGSCSGCALSSLTLAGVRKRLIDLVGRPLRVVPLSAVPIRLEARR